MLNDYAKAALIDIAEHMIFGILSVLPFIIKNPVYLLYAVFFSIFPDIDHVIVAKSLSFRKMLSLGRRPFLHSIPAVLLTTIMVYGLTHSFKISYIVFLTGVTHLTWDLCTGGVRLFYPIRKNFQISRTTALTLIFSFAVLSFIIIRV